MPQRIVFTGKNEIELEECAPSPLTAGSARLDVEYSLMSTGSENIVLQRAFAPGTEWDNWVQYPFYPGYCCVGRIAEVSGPADGLDVGARAILRWGHASEHVAPVDEFIPVPADVDPGDAVWFAMAKIASMGARAAQYRLGDSVCIVGAGPVGQMSVRWAYAAGVEHIVVCDLSESRLDIARQGGASTVIVRPAGEARDELAGLCGGLPRVVIDTTGHAPVFADCLSLCADRGAVVLLGDTGYPAEQHLTTDVVSRGITIVGAHDNHTDETWNEPSIARLFFNLVRSGRFRMEGLNTHTFRGSACRAAYDTAQRARADTLGILFDWRENVAVHA